VQVESLRCRGNHCDLAGEFSTSVNVDYVFAYTPTAVRYGADGSLLAQFDPPVECDSFTDFDSGVRYLYCAPSLSPAHLDWSTGEPYLVEGDADD